jgi:hypothetical protein
MDLDEARHEHPLWIERLEREGALEAALAPDPPVALRLLYFGFGYAMIILGVYLVVFGLMNVAALTLL